MDVKHIKLGSGRVYQFTTIHEATRYESLKIYDHNSIQLLDIGGGADAASPREGTPGRSRETKHALERLPSRCIPPAGRSDGALPPWGLTAEAAANAAGPRRLDVGSATAGRSM
jgi:hypothetical protein